ncbi:MAG: hypothetical protein JW810_02335 [Sedimentisphaerales bacterium]|nr:hypothetical protein [Sedimentisphaerales bacterium]
MKAMRNKLSYLALLCLLVQWSSLTMVLHVFTDTRHHSACRGGDNDCPKGSDASNCPICRQMLIVLGKVLIEPATTVQHHAGIVWAEMVPLDRYEIVSYGDSFLPRGPPAA